LANSRPLFALLVGINEYDPECGVPSLRGCVNDVRAMERLLVDSFGIPAENILTLLDSTATAAAIQNGFQSHLVQNAMRRSGQGAPQVDDAPAFLFYFSGHGSQARDLSGIEPDGMDETLVAYDSRTPGVYDIRDWELGEWIAQLNAVTEEVTVILDCCHSGSGTRDDEELPRSRACPPDLRAAPWRRPARAAVQRSLSPSNWETGAGHVLLAACRDREIAREHALIVDAPEGETIWRGALSWFLQQTLAEAPAGRPLTNRELLERVRSRVNAIYPTQTPQCEGDLDRDFLGSARRTSEPFFTVLQENEGLYWVNAGLAQGVRAGAILRVYPPQVRTRAEAVAAHPQGVAHLKVVREGVERSGCMVIDGDTGQESGRTIPPLARAEVLDPGAASARRGVRILLQSPRARVALAERIAAQDGNLPLHGWLKAVARDPDLRVEEADGEVFINDRSGDLIAGPYLPGDLESIALDLAHIARFRNVLELRNESPPESLLNAVHFEIKRLDLSQPKPVTASIPPGAEGEATVFAGTRIVYEVANRGPHPLYVGVFTLTEANEVTLLWPRVQGAREAILPGKTLAAGNSTAPQEQYECWLPEGVASSRDRYKVIVTTSDIDFSLLQQGPLGTPAQPTRGDETLSPLESLFARCVDGGDRSAADAPVPEEWLTLDATLTVLAPPQATISETRNPANPESIENRGSLGEAVRVTTPANFLGRIRYLTVRQAIHLHGEVGAQMPPGLAAFPTTFAPALFGSGGQGAMAGAGVIEVDCDEATRREISSQMPLLLHIPAQMAAAVIALAHDGRNWFPVGRAPGNAVQIAIEWLPRPLADPSTSQLASPARVVRLFLFRILEEPVAELGLFTVRFVPSGWSAFASRASFVRKVAGGDLRYTPAVRFKPRERVALVLHGLGGDSAQLALWLSTTLANLGVHYDRILAFEYEGVGTPVSENAALLAQRLAALGIRETEGVTLDIFAHSMGALIARVYVESLGGERVVRNTVMAAAPNLGTPLADAALLIPWLITLAVNLPLPTASGLLIAWAMGSLASEARGVADMGRRAALLESLNDSDRRTKVRYHLIAGDAGLTEEPEADDAEASAVRSDHLLRTLAEGVTHLSEWYFADANDLVVGVRSGIGARVDHAPGSVVLTRVLRCNHFGYFESEAVALQVARWLQAGAGSAGDRPQDADSSANHTLSSNGERAATRRILHFRSRPQRQ